MAKNDNELQRVLLGMTTSSNEWEQVFISANFF